MVSFSRRSVSFSRRSFVQRIGLGMGAAMLGPLAKNLIREAQGQAAGRKIAMFWFTPNGIHTNWVFSPPEFKEKNNEGGRPENDTIINSSAFTLPEAFSPLNKSQVLMLDGLQNHPRKDEDGGHGEGFVALTCVPGTDVNHYKPGNITYDQHLANTISAGTPRKSVLIASSSHSDQDMKNNLFAEGADKPIAAFQNPVLLFKDLFGNAMASTAAVGTPSVKNRVLFDGLRYDIARLESQFAAPEKDKLSQYLTAIETYEKSLAAAGSLSCTTPQAPTLTQTGDAIDVLQSLNDMASVALLCGMTNVMGVDIGTIDSHDYGPNINHLLLGTPLDGADGTSLGDVGHEGEAKRGPVLTALFKWMSSNVATTLTTLQADTNVASAFAMLSSDNGDEHHSQHMRWPLVLVGNAGSAVNLNGRFVRYSNVGWQDALSGQTGEQPSLIDVYKAIGLGLGVPDGNFGTHPDGKGPNARSNGPLPEMLA